VEACEEVERNTNGMTQMSTLVVPASPILFDLEFLDRGL